MISRFSDHAANERTFLAWIRTGLATVAFGFVIERFNVLILTMERADTSQLTRSRVLGDAGRVIGNYDGKVLIFAGTLLIALSAIRFVRTGRLIDAEEIYTLQSIRTELATSLVLIVAALCAFVVLL
ncbi:YidH family protein [Bradyrhizobium sp. NBAIM08]|uniref:YidH family protein n=1 Tax=Bradyrhizobium sp. NBAIM08 TaxID=2793815 RepID=UPI001CD5B6F9|nr:DUF202 domain-containing protein [Bradyrhizobium sp. NBAIM08]MCA1474233.1 DUF202 domain-containing protein [Bradyrhizobium sp. NBAIM08]